MSFVHLHVHSEYSLLDGYSKIKKLINRAKELEMPAVALTDHGTMYGVIDFFNQAQAADIKPIIGVEAYLSARGMKERDPQFDKKSSHLLLLAENQTGYQNLLKIASAAQLDGFYYFPRIDRDFLAAHSAGLICTTGCMSAEVPRLVQDGRLEEARKRLDWYYDVFGPDRFYFELQEHDIPELTVMNKALLQLGDRYQARYVATNDVHYVDPQDARLQDVMLAIQTGCTLADPDRMRMSSETYYLRTAQEMSSIFGEIPGALANTLEIAERCNVDLNFRGYRLPIFPLPEGFETKAYLRKLCEDGLRTHYGSRAGDPVVKERLEYELGVIHKMGFDAYFLIVWDLCRYARERGIWYNARGSAAGSIVAYTLGITLVDPIEHGLIFERFLNPGRISMPDIDLDFRDDMRSEMMEYCARRYGEDRVAQIITFGTLKARAAIRDVGRVLDIPLPEVDRVAKLVPNIPGKPVSIPEALETVSDFRKVYDDAKNDPTKKYLRELIDTAAQIEGVVRNAGTHAAGVIITDQPIIDYIPLNRPTGNNAEEVPVKLVTQFEMSVLESLGLLKVDFLGLATLTVMARACELIEQRHGITYTLGNIPVDDPEAFALMGRGDTAGVFQVEGSGMRRYLVQMKPQNLDHVIAMIALYRPGPLEFIPSYIARMHGEEKVEYRHPSLEPIFKETYGIAVYQEQIMRAAVELAGYTASEADDLRKAIAKKIKDKLEKNREKFIKGAHKLGVMSKEDAAIIFADWEEFARYGFNKAHAADYGVIAVQTAFLKAHYRAEYMSALMSVTKNDTDKVALYVADSRRLGIQVLPPDISASGWDFTIEDTDHGSCIRFGLGAIKNVGQSPVEAILAARRAGPFKDLNDLARRVDLRLVGKRALECLIKVGALDRFGNRAALLESMERIVAISSGHFRAAESGQISMFGGSLGVNEDIVLPPARSDVSRRQILDWERELIGLYVSDHPLAPYMEELTQAVTHLSAELAEAPNNARVRVAGVITHVRPHQTKTGKSMAFVTIEDLQGSVELLVFPRTWEQFQGIIQPENVVLVEGKLDNTGTEPKVLVDTITTEFKYVISANQPSWEIYTPPAGDELLSDEDGEPLETEPEGRRMSEPAPDPVWNAEAEFPDSQPAKPAPIATPAKPSSPEQRGTGAPKTDYDPPPPPAFPDDWYESDRGNSSAEMVKPAVVAVKEVNPEVETEQNADLPQSSPAVSPTPSVEPENTTEPPGVVAAATKEQTQVSTPNYILSPRSLKDGETIYMLTITLRPSGDKVRDQLRIRQIYGTLITYPGKDRFAFQIFERGRGYLIEFPNFTTDYGPELMERIKNFVGVENVRVEPLTFQ